jgi:hypothetical protein
MAIKTNIKMTSQLIGNKIFTYESSELIIKNTIYKFILTRIDGVIDNIQIKRVQGNNSMTPMNVFWSIDSAMAKYKNQEIRLHLLKLELGL